MSTRSVRVRISGRVQGVWYRAWTCEQAVLRNLDGWVRNMSDGSVEAVFSGLATDVDDMLRACHEGPGLAQVDTIDVEEETESVKSGFHQIPSGA